jgi:hypothetical protein
VEGRASSERPPATSDRRDTYRQWRRSRRRVQSRDDHQDELRPTARHQHMANEQSRSGTRWRIRRAVSHAASIPSVFPRRAFGGRVPHVRAASAKRDGSNFIGARPTDRNAHSRSSAIAARHRLRPRYLRVPISTATAKVPSLPAVRSESPFRETTKAGRRRIRWSAVRYSSRLPPTV